LILKGSIPTFVWEPQEVFRSYPTFVNAISRFFRSLANILGVFRKFQEFQKFLGVSMHSQESSGVKHFQKVTKLIGISEISDFRNVSGFHR
jgi:hypothetical protein